MIRNWTLRHGRITGQPNVLTLTKLVRSITITFCFFGLPALLPHIAFLLPGSPPCPPSQIMPARAGSALMWVLLPHGQGAFNDGYYFLDHRTSLTDLVGLVCDFVVYQDMFKSVLFL